MGLFANLSLRKRAPQPALATSAPAGDEVAAAAVAPAPVAVPTPPAAPAPDEATRAGAEELVRRVVQEMPDFNTVAVVEAATGTLLAGQWAGHSGGAVEVALANAEIVRQTNLAVEALHLAETEQLTDILITLRHQLHLLRVLPQAGWLLYLAVSSQATNPALVRAVAQLVTH